MNVKDLDPATLQAGPELDCLIAEKWMGWEWLPPYEIQIGGGPKHDYPRCGCWETPDGRRFLIWSPSTNPDHAGEARRVADSWVLTDVETVRHADGIVCHLLVGMAWHSGACSFAETDGDKDRAEALATCRAIAAAMQGQRKKLETKF
jgi:hypothetical protein